VRVRHPLALLCTVVCGLFALAGPSGCGDGSVDRIRAWEVAVPYLPPPELPRRTTSPAGATGSSKTAAGENAPASGAPSDSQVAAELRQAFKGKGRGNIVDSATLTTADLATVPPAAPAKVAAIINAGNQVARRPYVYGGGHGGGPEGLFVDTAYDCSGSISFALAAAGLIDSPMDSTTLANYGKPGPGKWVTIYANAGHAFMFVAGLRFDTVGRATHGSRWQATTRTVAGFTVRHPPGL
jgi:cell wall-associated NlpC family hydrolase